MIHGQVLQKWQQPTAVETKEDKRRAAESNWRTVCRLVDERDGYCCRVCEMAGPQANAQHHHVRYRSRGGADVTSNVVRLCRTCHSLEHAKKIAIEGDADKAPWLTISRRDHDGRWFVAEQEHGVRVYIRHD